jgi:hypothetical protein
MYSNSSNVLFIAEAGQNLFEDVNMILNGGNYGWHLREGTHCFNVSSPNNPPPDGSTVGSFGEPLIGPIFEGGHDLGAVVVGGEIYHGDALPAFRNKYVFGYFTFSPKLIGDNTIFVASPPANWSVSQLPSLAKDLQPSDIEMWPTQNVTVDNALLMEATGIVRAISAGEDGELYVLASSVLGPNAATSTGTVYKIVPSYPLQTIESCDASGNVKNTFNVSDSVHVFGSGFPASSTFDIRVVADQGSWTALNGMPIPTSLPTDIQNITSDSSGNIAVSLLWLHPSLGNYDIIVDVNRNGLYDIGIDAVDNDDVVTAGVVIIPEISLAAALYIITLLTVFAALKHRKLGTTNRLRNPKIENPSSIFHPPKQHRIHLDFDRETQKRIPPLKERTLWYSL